MSPSRSIPCARLIQAAHGAPLGAPLGPATVEIAEGRITAVTPGGSGAETLLALPALVNAHDHGRPVRSSSIGGGGKPLESWIQYLGLFPSVDPYLAAAVSLSRSALGGAGVVMMHYTRTQGFTDLPTEAQGVARAARDVGVRVGFAVSLRDRNPLAYGPSEPILAALPPDVRALIASRMLRPAPSPAEYVALVEAVADAAAGPGFDVQYGPNGPQWCSDALLAAIAEASARTGRRVHMHLLETRYQRAWADAAHPEGLVRHLDALGLLSPRLTLAHCVWARPDELDLLAERGVTIVTNPSSNLHLRSGMAPVARMMKAGCRVAIGLDGKAFDEDDDALRELRLAHLLHAGTGFRTAVTREAMLEAIIRNGRQSVTNRAGGGLIREGEPADLLLLDWAAIEDDRLRDDLDPLDLMLTRATAAHIRELIVGGYTVVKDGAVTGIDYPVARRELLAEMRGRMAETAALSSAMPALEQALAQHFEPDGACC